MITLTAAALTTFLAWQLWLVWPTLARADKGALKDMGYLVLIMIAVICSVISLVHFLNEGTLV
jgi:hypothetical protein